MTVSSPSPDAPSGRTSSASPGSNSAMISRAVPSIPWLPSGVSPGAIGRGPDLSHAGSRIAFRPSTGDCTMRRPSAVLRSATVAGDRHGPSPGGGRDLVGVLPVVHPGDPDGAAVARGIVPGLRGVEILAEVDPQRGVGVRPSRAGTPCRRIGRRSTARPSRRTVPRRSRRP